MRFIEGDLCAVDLAPAPVRRGYRAFGLPRVSLALPPPGGRDDWMEILRGRREGAVPGSGAPACSRGALHCVPVILEDTDDIAGPRSDAGPRCL